MSSVVHKWEPSARLMRLVEKHGGTTERVFPPARYLALETLEDRGYIFRTKAEATRVRNCLLRHYGENLTTAELIFRVRNSWASNGNVRGDLQNVRNLGVVAFEKLRFILKDG
jgi:hypothetical protein